MSTIWIVEKPGLREYGVAKSLLGDFALRLLASMASLEKFLRMYASTLPDLVAINLAGGEWSYEQVERFCQQRLVSLPILVFDPDNDRLNLGKESLGPYLKLDALSLSRLMNEVVATSSRERRTKICYRDLTLDCDRLQFSISPSEELQGLPLKEAQLLKLFLEHPGICLGREDIQKMIWCNIKITSRTIDSHISRLRKRLHGAEASIESVYGGGYLLR